MKNMFTNKLINNKNKNMNTQFYEKFYFKETIKVTFVTITNVFLASYSNNVHV